MAKKASGKTYTSKGERQNVNQKTLNAMKQDRYLGEDLVNIQNAWLEGRNPWITIQNPNKEETNKKFIRVKSNQVKGSPKDRQKKMFIIAGSG